MNHDGDRSHQSTRVAGRIAVAAALSCLLSACAGFHPYPVGEPFSFVVDTRIVPSRQTVPGEEGLPPRPLAVLIAPDGSRDEFVANEVIVRPRSTAELDQFLDTYGGIVVRDGKPLIIAGATPRGPIESSGFYLVRIDPARSAVEDLVDNMGRSRIGGAHIFSSDMGVRLAALLAREAQRFRLGPNVLHRTDASLEHPDNAGGHIDWETMLWMTEDADANLPGDQGLSIGVAEAWRYLRYLGLPRSPEPGEPIASTRVTVALIDRGFALDPTTGVPLGGNLDYRNALRPPLQADAEHNDNRAGGEVDDGPSLAKRWHGTGTFGICCAQPRNLYGGAGTGGPVVRPMLVRTGLTGYSMHDAIHSAAVMGADVVSISMSNRCGTICDIGDVFLGGLLKDKDGQQSAIYTAIAFGATVLAAASNAGEDISDKPVIPCKLDKVICVGSVGSGGGNLHNYGEGVDIWGYGGSYRTTVIPETAARDANDTGLDELLSISATSAATPMVAGVVALMKAVDPTLRWDRVQNILQQTANRSSDPRVRQGYVDALRAVQRVQPNLPPAVRFNIPGDGATPSHQRTVYLHADVDDPESGAAFRGEVVFSSDVDGELCRTTGFVTGCRGPVLSLGSHRLTATAVDPFGAAAADSVDVAVINQVPIARIVLPETGATFFADQNVNFRGYGFDWDELLGDAALAWQSDRDGDLGSGRDIAAVLTEGAHAISLVATDSLGLQGSAMISVSILPAAGHPSVTIVQPDDGLMIAPGQSVTLMAQGSDPEDGVLDPAAFEWFSDVDGSYGVGNPLVVTPAGPASPCNPELVAHTISVRATDSAGNGAEHAIRVSVGAIC